jgi:hypothetical protein
MPSDPESINPDQINTDGGAFVGGPSKQTLLFIPGATW